MFPILFNFYNDFFSSSMYLTTILSATYAILLVTLGLMIFLSDPFLEANVSPVSDN